MGRCRRDLGRHLEAASVAESIEILRVKVQIRRMRRLLVPERLPGTRSFAIVTGHSVHRVLREADSVRLQEDAILLHERLLVSRGCPLEVPLVLLKTTLEETLIIEVAEYRLVLIHQLASNRLHIAQRTVRFFQIVDCPFQPE